MVPDFWTNEGGQSLAGKLVSVWQSETVKKLPENVQLH